MTSAPTRPARQARIAELIAARPVTSQTQLAALLAQDGIDVTQANGRWFVAPIRTRMTAS